MSDTSPTPTKIELRMSALARRAALSEAYRDAAARAIATRAFPFAVTSGAIVSGYVSIRSEIDPVPIMTRLSDAGATLALPAIVARDQALAFRAWTPTDALHHGAHGIPEPVPDAPEVMPDILLVPLAAFDRAGHRIGYGAGHYDRTFARLRTIKPFIAVGLAFDTQEIESIPMQPHDVALDYVLTETRTIHFRSS